MKVNKQRGRIKLQMSFCAKKNISALAGDAGVGRLHTENLHQEGGVTGRKVSPAKLVVFVFFLP